MATSRSAVGVSNNARDARGCKTGDPSSRMAGRFRKLFGVSHHSLYVALELACEAHQAKKVVPDKRGHRGQTMHVWRLDHEDHR